MSSLQEVISEYQRRNETSYAHSDDPLKMTVSELNQFYNLNATLFFNDRLLEPINPLISAFPDATWLTLGDGAMGKEAYYLQKRGVSVTATDIDDRILSYVHKQGFIKNYARQDAERLTYPDKSFDFVFCKNTLHHLARPYLGIYEMLRVANKAVVIMEPQDPKINDNLKAQSDGAFEEYQALLFGNTDFFFEKCGNYIYRLSERELEKVAFGMSRTKIAFRGINEIEYSLDINNNPEAFNETMRNLAIKDLISSSGHRRFEVLMTIIFVDNDVPSTIDQQLSNVGWQVKNLPPNPYI